MLNCGDRFGGLCCPSWEADEGDDVHEDDQAKTPGDRASASSTEQSEPAVSIRRSTLFTLLAGVIVAIALGAGGYAVGKNSGEDLEAARVAGTSAGKAAGENRGQARGFRAGLTKGKSLGFAVSFNQAYKRAYIETWEEAGLDAPAKKDIKVSR